jgi:uracil-DNA glycosylase
MKNNMRKMSDRGFDREIVSCRACPRLVAWRETIARDRTKRYRDEEYWGAPVPSFGAVSARLIIVGLAPAAHGANRTGRMFTGDNSGAWLYPHLFHAGFCTAPHSVSRDDGMQLIDARITAVAHCAPPGNKLLPEEIALCSNHFAREMALLNRKQIILALGRVAYKAIRRYFGAEVPVTVPDFGHGAAYRTASGLFVIASYHPSQQNTYTGKLTETMFTGIFSVIRNELPDFDNNT